MSKQDLGKKRLLFYKAINDLIISGVPIFSEDGNMNTTLSHQIKTFLQDYAKAYHDSQPPKVVRQEKRMSEPRFNYKPKADKDGFRPYPYEN